MKHISCILLIACTVGTDLVAQNPPNPAYVQTPSNMRIQMNLNNMHNPVYGSFYPGILIDDYIHDLIHAQDVSISNIDSNSFFSYPNGGYWGNGFYDSLHFNVGRFHFIGNSDVGIDTGIIMATERVFYHFVNSSLSNEPGIFPGLTHPAVNHSSGGSTYTLNGSTFVNPDSLTKRWTQYPELVAINGGDSIWDANVLEFDIVPKGNFISLDYVFASEEWPLYHCQPGGTDVMGIFLSGPGIAGQKNIATLPGTNTPVNPHTVYPPNTPCRPEAPTGSPYYVDNTGGQNIIFNGFTKVLRAAAIVQPCQTYRLKIMVADGTVHENDTTWKSPNSSWESWMNLMGYESTKKRMLYDSGLMLKMRSLRSMDSVRIQALGGTQTTAQYPYAVRGCLNGKIRLSVQHKLPIDRSFQLQLSGTAMPGQDFQPFSTTVFMPAEDTVVDIDVTALAGGSGNKELKVKLLSPYGNCSDWGQFLDSTSLIISDGYYVSVTPADTNVAPGSSVQLQASGEPFLSYAWTPNTYLNQTNIANPISTPQQSIQYTVSGMAPQDYPCPDATNTVRINMGTGINENETHLGISVFPNPSKDFFTLNGDTEGIYELIITDYLGRDHGNFKGNIITLNQRLQTITLASGVYLLKITDTNGKQQIIKVSKY